MVLDRLVIATGNRHKFGEIAEFLDGIPVQLASLDDFPPIDPPDETETTFEGNAVLKARYYCEQLDIPCVADDSGIVIDALDGGPGVFSARFAGEGCSDDDNNAKVLAALSGVSTQNRTARFVCVAALAERNGVIHTVTGVVEGRIAPELRGRNGFGYDPLFMPEGYDQTFGELGPTVKASMSHRSRAFAQIRALLELTP
jgi:XTP/dITP diphosphohydrolase